MGIKPSSQNNNINVNQHIGTAYDNVAIVAENIDDITLVADAIEGGLEGKVSSIQAGDNIEIDDTDPINPIVSAVIPELTDYVEEVVGGTNVTVDNTDPKNPIINCEATGGQVDTVVGGTNVTIDNTDPINPIINCQDSGGQVDEIVAGDNITVDNTDPTRPIISSSGGETPGFLMQDAEDAELNNILTAQVGTSFTYDWVGGSALTSGTAKLSDANTIMLHAIDSTGKVSDTSLNGLLAYIKIGDDEPFASVVTQIPFNTNFKISWDSLNTYDIPANVVITIALANWTNNVLVEGDAWVRNAAGKFVPTQVALKSDLGIAGLVNIETALHTKGSGGPQHYHPGKYDTTGDFTFEIDFLMPEGTAYKNLFTLGGNSDKRYGSIYMYKTNAAGQYSLVISANGVNTTGNTPLTTDYTDCVGSRVTLTIVREADVITVWCNGVHNKTTTTFVKQDLIPNADLTLYSYADDSIIQSDASGLEVYGWRFVQRAIYSHHDGVTAYNDITLIPIIGAPTGVAKSSTGISIEAVTGIPDPADPNTLYIVVEA